MKKLIILRGVSGSGKSTKAVELTSELRDVYPDSLSIICSADMFFINRTSGEYEFDAQKLGHAHLWCKTRAETAMVLGAELIIIDNTNTQKWEFKDYIDMAKLYGYESSQEVCGDINDEYLIVYADRNKHGVPLSVIKKQAARFEV